MKRVAMFSIVWILSIAFAAGSAYWVGLQQRHTLWTESDLQIAQPLTELQRQLLLSTPSANVFEGTVVSVSEPGKSPHLFLASVCGPKGKLDLDPCKSPKKNPPLYNPFKDDKPPRSINVPNYVPYPCKVGLDSAGNVIWGVCFKRKS